MNKEKYHIGIDSAHSDLADSTVYLLRSLENKRARTKNRSLIIKCVLYTVVFIGVVLAIIIKIK